MSRPKKQRKAATENRTPKSGFPVGPLPPQDLSPPDFLETLDFVARLLDHLKASQGEGRRRMSIEYAMMDPMKEHGSFPFLLRSAFFDGKIDPEQLESLGDFFVRILNLPACATERIFKSIIGIQRNLENAHQNRRVSALVAYDDFFTEVGKEPTKPQLKAYMQARREIYKDQPGPDEPWTRLWKETGLFNLPDR